MTGSRVQFAGAADPDVAPKARSSAAMRDMVAGPIVVKLQNEAEQ
jgi:hypothetical protein